MLLFPEVFSILPTDNTGKATRDLTDISGDVVGLQTISYRKHHLLCRFNYQNHLHI